MRNLSSRNAGEHFGKHGIAPCEFLIDNQWSHYAAQQNIYAVLLKQQYHISLESMHLVQLHENQQSYKLIDIPFFEDVAIEMLDRCVEMLRQAPTPPVVVGAPAIPKMIMVTEPVYFRLHNALSYAAMSVCSQDIPKVLIGNCRCVASSIANATEDWDRIADIVGATGNPYEQISSYEECQDLFDICLKRHDSLDVNRCGRFLLIFFSDTQQSHAMAFVSLSDTVLVKDDNSVWELKRNALLGVLREFVKINEFTNFEFVRERGYDLDVKASWAAGVSEHSQQGGDHAVVASQNSDDPVTASVPVPPEAMPVTETDHALERIKRKCQTFTPPTHPPMLKGEHPRLNVPADEWCLYHCFVAAANPALWIKNHEKSGKALSAEIVADDKQKAKVVREWLLNAHEEAGDMPAVDRLNTPGRCGYPTDNDLMLFSRYVSGQIMLFSEIDGSMGSARVGTPSVVYHPCTSRGRRRSYSRALPPLSELASSGV